jgi:hypothetical protein
MNQQVIGVNDDTGAAEASRELLFFSLAIGTLALSDLRDVDVTMRGRRGYQTLNNLSLLVILSSAALYGVFLTVHSKHTIGIALFGFGVGTWAQLVVNRGESNARHC